MQNSWIIRAKFMQSSCKVRTKFAQSSRRFVRVPRIRPKFFEILSDSFYIASNSQPIRTKFAQDSCKIRARFVQDSSEIRARFVPIHAQFGKIRAWFVPNSCLIRTEFVRSSAKYMKNSCKIRGNSQKFCALRAHSCARITVRNKPGQSYCR